MSRPLRIEYEGAWYHVINRGLDRRDIFQSNRDRMKFIELLAEITERFRIEIHSYCLMSNHYHLLIRTPFGNLGRAMRHLNGVYTQRYNRFSHSDGPIFRGRYKAILVEPEDMNILQISRYIHANPVKARICNYPKQYKWSSYNAFIKQTKSQVWLCTDFILQYFVTVKKFMQFMNFFCSNELSKFYESKCASPIFGTKEFKEKILKTIDQVKHQESNKDLIKLQHLPKITDIMNVVTSFFKNDLSSLKQSKRGSLNLPRQIGIYLSRTFGLCSYSEIAKHFGNINIYGLRSALRRMQVKIHNDFALQKLINDITILIKQKPD